MPNIGPLDRRTPPADVRAHKRYPKPDFVRTTLNAAELHAYYIAVLSARSLAMTRDHALKPT